MAKAEALHSTRQMTAIEAIVQGRFNEAQTIILSLLDDANADRQRLFPRGQCRYCKCTEDHPCGIMVVPGPEFEPGYVTCGWADEERTICTNKRCLERWRREQPEFVGEASHLVLP